MRACGTVLIMLGLVMPSYSADKAPALTPEQKVAVDSLDVILAGYDVLVAKITDPDYKAATVKILDSLKARCAVVRKNFDQGFYNDLKLDIYAEYQRTGLWLAPLKTPPRAVEPGGAVDRNAALATPEGQQTALTTLEWQIKSLESRSGRRPEGDPERLAIKSIRDRHTALGLTFSKGDYDVLIAEIAALGQRRRAESTKTPAPTTK